MESLASVAILIASYKRPVALARLLASISANEYSGSFRVVVVDNDPDGSAFEAVDAAEVDTEYVLESRPGIVAARNCALGRIRSTDDAAVFVDDDQVVNRDWIQQLVDTAQAYAADVVAGPVFSDFPEDTPTWVLKGGFLRTRTRSTGDEMTMAATGNVLIRSSTLERLGKPQFDGSFSLTGGEDYEFFLRLSAGGARIVWCAEAVSVESVAASRVNARYIVRRAVRGGSTCGRLLLRRRPWLVVMPYGFLEIARGLMNVGLGRLRYGFFRASEVVPMLEGVGIVMACLGREVRMYGRAA